MIELALSQSLATSEATPLDEWRAVARSADEAGLSFVGMADVVTRNFEMTVGLTLLALSTSSIRIASTVTNPLLRHPGVNAAAFASLQHITGGRMIFGISTGDSVLHNLGLGRATLADVRDHVETFRSLLATGRAVYRGRETRLPWAPAIVERPVPVFLAAKGPKSLRLAGEIADGVLTGQGFDPAVVDETLAHVRAGAEAAGRDAGEIEVWFQAPVAIDSDPARAIDAVLGDAVAAIRMPGWCGALTSPAVPEDVKERIRVLRARYDVGQHAASGNTNVGLAAELGLEEFLAGWLAVAGTEEDVVRRFRELEALGVRRLYVTNAAPDPRALLARLTRVRLATGA
jgi:5,10-methylenetetrahydromethanopterin reductase